MKTNQRENKGIQILEVSGEIDFHTSHELREKFQGILDKRCPKLLVNLQKVTYIDSSGLATFVEIFQKMNHLGGKLVLAGLSSAVRGVFEIAKLDSIFELSDSEEKALSSLAK
jgi:anti-sigma B factor antagonist